MIHIEDFWQELLDSELKDNSYWKEKILDPDCKIHLALMVEPYLSLILNGRKTIESRFSRNKIKPYNSISKGDIVVLKRSGGGLVAVFEAGDVWFKQIGSDKDLCEIKSEYGAGLCLDDQFWERKRDANYVTLINISHLQILSPIEIKRANRQSWITYEKID